jgi:hypothetical protein
MTTENDPIYQALESEIQGLLERANALADEYWVEKMAQNIRPVDERGKYGVRVRRKTYAISIEWSRVHFYGPKGNRRPRSVYLRRGRSYRYDKRLFNEAADWERALIDQLEEEFAKIRESSARLLTMRQNWQTYLKHKKPDSPE